MNKHLSNHRNHTGDPSRTAAIVPLLRFQGKWAYFLYNSVCLASTLGGSFRRKVLSFARLTGRERMLDIGAGTGSFVATLKATFPDSRVIGIEPDEHSLNFGRKKAEKLGLECEFICARSEGLPIPDTSVDVCFQMLVLHHLSFSQKREALLEAKRVLVPGGRLIIADFRKIAFPFFANFFIFEQRDRLRENFEGKVEELLEEVGFSVVEKKKKQRFSLIALYSAKKTAL